MEGQVETDAGKKAEKSISYRSGLQKGLATETLPGKEDQKTSLPSSVLQDPLILHFKEEKTLYEILSRWLRSK